MLFVARFICSWGCWHQIAYIGGTCFSNTYARGTSAKNTSSIIGDCIKSASSENTGTESIDKKSTYTKNAGIVEHSGMYLHFFSILKIENTRFEIWIKTSYIKNTCISSANTDKHSGIHSWSSWILEWGQYGTRSKTRIRVG